MPNGSSGTAYRFTTNAWDDDTTGGWSTNVRTYNAICRLQQQVFTAWTSTTSSCTTNDWPTTWLIDSGTSATTGSVTISTSGNTDVANAIWALQTWQDCRHTNRSRWTPTVHRNPKSAEDLAREAAERERRRQIRLREDARKRRFKEAANERARRLLVSMLNDDQRQELEEKNHFHLTVHSRDGSMKVYRIEYGFQGNVKLLGPDGVPVRRYCIHADSRLPYEDQMLAQKLLLETNEEEFLRVANMTRLRAA